MTPFWLMQKTMSLVSAGLLAVAGYYFFRGHNHPGGGFVGGLLIAAVISSQMLGQGVKAESSGSYLSWAALGLLITIASGFVGTFLNSSDPYLTSYWSPIKIPLLGKLGTPLIFDLGIMLTVAGVVGHFVEIFSQSATRLELPREGKN